MRELPESIDTFERAMQYLHLGYQPVILRPRSKVPLQKGWQTKRYGEEDLFATLDGTTFNLGLLCGGDLVVLDIDSTDAADLEWIIENVGDTPMKARTPRGGIHCFYRARQGIAYGNGVKLRGKPYDMRHSGTFIVVSPSIGENGRPYVWLGSVLPAKELPFMKVSPLRERKPTRRLTPIEPSPDQTITEQRAWAWTACVEGCIEGEGGCHNKLFRVTCKLLHPPPRGFGLSVAQAWPILLAFNEHCEPEWSLKELEHKIDDAMKKI